MTFTIQLIDLDLSKWTPVMVSEKGSGGPYCTWHYPFSYCIMGKSQKVSKRGREAEEHRQLFFHL